MLKVVRKMLNKEEINHQIKNASEFQKNLFLERQIIKNTKNFLLHLKSPSEILTVKHLIYSAYSLIL